MIWGGGFSVVMTTGSIEAKFEEASVFSSRVLVVTMSLMDPYQVVLMVRRSLL